MTAQGAGAPPTSGDTAFHLTLASSVTYDDNLFLASRDAISGGSEDDLILAILPGMEVGRGDEELTHWSVSLTEGFFYYLDHSAENDQLAVVRAEAGTQGARSSVDFSGSFQQLRQNTRDIRNLAVLVRRDRSDANLNGHYQFSPKTSIAGGVGYFAEDFKLAGFADLQRVQVPVDVYYELSPTVDLSGGYRYQQSRRRGITNLRYTDHFLNIGARGEFTPKISGAFKIGLSHRAAQAQRSQDTIGFDGSLAWEATPKIRVEADFGRDFDSSSLSGEGVKRTDGSLRVAYAISAVFAAGASVRREWVDYVSGRSDELTALRAFLNYQPNESVGLSLAWDHDHNASNIPLAAYNHNTLSLSASYRY